MIAYAKKHHNGEFLCESLYDLDFLQNSFDGFWAAASLLHVPKSRLHLALNSIKSVVRKPGAGFISIKEGKDEEYLPLEINNPDEKIQKENLRMFALWEQDGFKKALEDNGIKVIKISRKISPLDKKRDFLCYFVKLS